MNQKRFSAPLAFENVKVTDGFWKRAMELVRKEVIPYQWEVLNDRVPEATPSWCMHNFRAAARLHEKADRLGEAFEPPVYTFRGFEALPEDPEHPDEDRFYGFVFQDSDFYKWIEAVGFSLSQHPDAELEAVADGAIDAVCAAQRKDGYLDTYYIINGMDAAWTNLRDHHELYCFGHLTEAAVAYYQGTGKDKLLRAACRFADYIDAHFGPEDGKHKGYPGHEVAEMGLIRLYSVTGEKRYLELSRYFVEQRGQDPKYFAEEEAVRAQKEGRAPRPVDLTYYQANAPVRELNEALGHAVRAVYLYSGMADVSRVTEDESLFDACNRLWDSIVNEKLYITGGIGGTHVGEAFSYPYDLPNDSAYSETCAAIGLVFFARRMLQLRPDSRYADVMEQALYNTVLAGMALDGKSFFYVNPLSVVPQACERDARLHHVKPVRQKWFGCACCPPNIARMVSSVAQYAYTENGDTLFTHLYIGGQVSKAFGGKKLTMTMDAQLPWEGSAKAVISAQEPVEATLAFRLPGWAENPSVNADGKRQTVKDGYVYLSGMWQDGDAIAFDFPMNVQMWQADTRVREDVGCVAFTRGPITFCAEEADNGADLHLLTVDGESIAVEKSSAFGHETVQIKVSGKRTKASTGSQLYRKAAKPETEDTTITLIPYYAWANRGKNEMRVWLRI